MDMAAVGAGATESALAYEFPENITHLGVFDAVLRKLLQDETLQDETLAKWPDRVAPWSSAQWLPHDIGRLREVCSLGFPVCALTFGGGAGRRCGGAAQQRQPAPHATRGLPEAASPQHPACIPATPCLPPCCTLRPACIPATPCLHPSNARPASPPRPACLLAAC